MASPRRRSDLPPGRLALEAGLICFGAPISVAWRSHVERARLASRAKRCQDAPRRRVGASASTRVVSPTNGARTNVRRPAPPTLQEPVFVSQFAVHLALGAVRHSVDRTSAGHQLAPWGGRTHHQTVPVRRTCDSLRLRLHMPFLCRASREPKEARGALRRCPCYIALGRLTLFSKSAGEKKGTALRWPSLGGCPWARW